jgi:hypothetical protein
MLKFGQVLKGKVGSYQVIEKMYRESVWLAT